MIGRVQEIKELNRLYSRIKTIASNILQSEDSTMTSETGKKIRVSAAIICQSGRIFATQRGYGEFKDGWEFPGGKIEKGE